MENKQVVVITDEQSLERAFESILRRRLDRLEKSENENESFGSDKLSISKAAEFAGMSIPTFNRRVNAGVFKKYGTGRKIFFLKSEIIESLKNSNL